MFLVMGLHFTYTRKLKHVNSSSRKVSRHMRFRILLATVSILALAACQQTPAPPDAPSALSAAAGDAEVMLTWDASATADVTYNVYRSDSATVDVDVANQIDTDLTQTSYTDSSVTNGTTYYYVVTAEKDGVQSGASNEVSATPSTTAGAACAPYSTLACDELQVTAPFALTWDASEGGLEDTGFTMVLPAENFTGADPSVDGLTPGNLAIVGGELVITSTSGIMFTTANDQENALGVGVDASSARMFDTTIVGPEWPENNTFQQAGLWFGVDDGNYVKLAVVSETVGEVYVQLLKEENDVSPDPTVDPSFRIDSAAIPVGATTTIQLSLTVDPVADTATASYSVDGGGAVNLGSLDIDPALFDGVNVDATNTMSFAGVYASDRFASASIDAAFEGFSVTQP